MYCKLPVAGLCLNWSNPLFPLSMSIRSDAGNSAIVTDGVGYGACFAIVALPVGLLVEFSAVFLYLVT